MSISWLEIKLQVLKPTEPSEINVIFHVLRISLQHVSKDAQHPSVEHLLVLFKTITYQVSIVVCQPSAIQSKPPFLKLIRNLIYSQWITKL